MPINNITQTVSTIPAPPHRGVDVQTVFVIKQEDFQDHLTDTTITELNTLKDQLNTRIGEINSTVTTMNSYADTASAGASTATTKAGEASTSASDALSYKNQAETFKNNASASATKASQWADNNYNVEVETGKYSAKHWSTVAQNATEGKVNKVTSTDNAIVRFDGVTGAVQNSGVIIDDSGNITASDITSTNGGSEAFSINYIKGQKVNVLSSARGSSTWSIGFGVKPSSTTIGEFISTADNVNWTRGALLVDGTLKFLKAPAQNTAVGSTVSMIEVFRTTTAGDLLLTSGTGALGYGTGAGGEVTQLTSKSTAVTLNKPSGCIFTHNAALAAGASVMFRVNNNIIVSNSDTIVLSGSGVATSYRIEVVRSIIGYFEVRITNISAGSLSDIVSFTFSIIKGANA